MSQEAKQAKARLASRIAGRKSADAIAELLEWESQTGAEFADGFLRRMRQLLPMRADAKQATQESIESLGKTILEFGTYCGGNYDKVPLDRLTWYHEIQVESAGRLKAYLLHPDLDQHRLKHSYGVE